MLDAVISFRATTHSLLSASSCASLRESSQIVQISGA